MADNNPLSEVKPTTWYKALALVAAPAFLIALAAGRDPLMLICGGILLLAIGEWRYHTRTSTEFRAVPGLGIAKITDRPRELNLMGIVLQGAGALCVLYGCFRFISTGTL